MLVFRRKTFTLSHSNNNALRTRFWVKLMSDADLRLGLMKRNDVSKTFARERATGSVSVFFAGARQGSCVVDCLQLLCATYYSLKRSAYWSEHCDINSFYTSIITIQSISTFDSQSTVTIHSSFSRLTSSLSS
jgi:hypothetical protein